MKVLHVTSSYAPAWQTGGVTRVVYEIATREAGLGHQVSVFTTDWGIPRGHPRRGNPADLEGVSVRYFRNLSEVLARNKIILPLLAPATLRREVAGFDVVHIHEHRTLLAAAAAHYARKAGVPYIVQPHGSLPFGIGKARLYGLFYLVAGRAIIEGASRLVASNDFEAGQFAGAGIPAGRCEIIPNGIDTAACVPPPGGETFRAAYGIPASGKVVLYLGRLNPIKGIDILIRAFSSVAAERGDVRLVIAGPDDGYLAGIQRLVGDPGLAGRVLVTGPLPERMKFLALRDADLFVLPSRYDNFPVTVLEALACGTPALITSHCGLAGMVREAGGPVADGDEASISAGIRLLLGDEAAAEAYAAKAREILARDFDWGGIIPRYLDLYRRCMEGGKKPRGTGREEGAR